MRTSAFRVRYAQRGGFYSSCTHRTRFSLAFRKPSIAFALLTARSCSPSQCCWRGLDQACPPWRFAFSVITSPDGAVTFTVSRTVHVVFGAMLLFSWQTISPSSLVWRSRTRAQPRRAGDADVVEGRALRHLRGQHFVNSVIRSQVPYREGIGEQVALMDWRWRGFHPQVEVGPCQPTSPSRRRTGPSPAPT